MQIKNLTVFDEGEYICTGTNSVGSVSSRVEVQILSLPVTTITPSVNNYTLTLGDSLQLVCHATGKPDPRVVWYKIESKPFIM